MQKLMKRIGWSIMMLLAIATVVYFVLRYLSFNPALSRVPLNPALPLHFSILVIHVLAGGLLLLLGPLQFLPRLRATRPGIHRITGRIYLICLLPASIAGFFVAAVFSLSDVIARTGFATLAIFWLFSGLQAYRAIRQGQIQLHRIWMIRNYTLAFAPVIFRLLGPLNAAVFHLPNQLLYDMDSWLTWAIPLTFIEWSVNQKLWQSLTRKPSRQSSPQRPLVQANDAK